MITRAEFIARELEHGDVQGALRHVLDRAWAKADVPEKSVDPWRDYKACLNRMISELCAARNE